MEAFLAPLLRAHVAEAGVGVADAAATPLQGCSTWGWLSN